MNKAIITICLVLLVPMVCAFGAELLVPSQYSTIQAAVDAAEDNDTVIISPGTYTGDGNRDIDFLGKAITVRSIDPNDPNIVATTIIDCNGSAIEPHRGFYFHNDEGPDSLISGLKIINGYAPLYEYPSGSQYWFGGAIYCSLSSPTISLCRFERNYAEYYGGAIACDGGTPAITECIIINNIAQSGGGVFIIGSGSPILSRCIISYNTARKTEIDLGWSRGGGLFCWGGSTISDSLFIENTSEVGGAIFAGGDIRPHENVHILNCTITGNSANSAGAVYCGESSAPSIVSSILWGNKAENGSEIAMTRVDYGSGLFVRYSNIKGGKEGIFEPGVIFWKEGNIDIDPCFHDSCTGDYHLQTDSPCINSGDPNYICGPNETDLDGNPRVRDGRIDMGAYEFQSNTLPVADAGQDQTVYAWIDVIADVTLDGSGSYDEDGDELTYQWSWSIDSDTYDTNGVNPTIELPVGQHVISLIVNDGTVDSEPDEVIVTVVEPIEEKLCIVPKVINRQRAPRKITAVLRLAEGITKDQVDNTKKLLLYPGGIEADWQFISGHRRYSKQPVFILARFDATALLEEVSTNGPVQLDVVGQFETGQYFNGSDTINIMSPPRRPPWRWWSWHRK